MRFLINLLPTKLLVNWKFKSTSSTSYQFINYKNV